MQAFVITTLAESDETRLGISRGMRIHAGTYNWSDSISGAKWFETREDAIDFMYEHQYVNDRAILKDRLATGDWQILELTYEVNMTAIEPEEHDERLRRNALQRLSQEDRRVLGLAF